MVDGVNEIASDVLYLPPLEEEQQHHSLRFSQKQPKIQTETLLPVCDSGTFYPFDCTSTASTETQRTSPLGPQTQSLPLRSFFSLSLFSWFSLSSRSNLCRFSASSLVRVSSRRLKPCDKGARNPVQAWNTAIESDRAGVSGER